jgi:hypothetical protein
MAEMDTPAPVADTQAPEGTETGSEFEGLAIPDTYADSPIGKYKTVGELAKGYSEAQKLIGAKGVIIPGEKATPEEWNKYYTALGRPEKPEGYKFSPIENLHPEVKSTPETEAGFKSLMHKHGIPAKQADGLYKDYMGLVSGALTKRDEKMGVDKHEAEKALRNDWGADYDDNVNKVRRLIDKFGGEGGREAFGDLGNNPKVLKTIANIAKKFSEDGFVKGAATQNSETKEANQRITDIMLNREHPFWVAGPGHAEAVAEMQRLQKVVHPEVEV